jgi:hypothetical protein
MFRKLSGHGKEPLMGVRDRFFGVIGAHHHTHQAHHTTLRRGLKSLKPLQKTTAPQAHRMSFWLGKLIAYDPAHTPIKLNFGHCHCA